MPLPGSGTENDKYQIASAADWDTAVSEGLSPCILMNNIDVANGSLRSAAFNLDLNGYTISNIGGAVNQFNQQQPQVIGSGGVVYNGELHFSYNRSDVSNFYPIRELSSGFIRLTLSGSITNGTTGGGVKAIASIILVSAAVENIKSSINLIAETCEIFGTFQSAANINKTIYTGMMSGSVTNRVYENNFGSITNFFYDGTINPTMNTGSLSADIQKTTAELQVIATYTDIQTPGLDDPFDMAEEASHTSELWILPVSDYPDITFTTASGWNPYKVNGEPQEGIVVTYIEYDNRNKVNPNILEVVVSDANGNAPLSGSVTAGKHLAVQATYTVPDPAPTGLTAGDTYSDIERWITDYPE